MTVWEIWHLTCQQTVMQTTNNSVLWMLFARTYLRSDITMQGPVG